jgi:hypothetical protein
VSIDEYPSVVRWLNNLRHSSAETYLHYLKRFCDYARLNPDQLVEAVLQALPQETRVKYDTKSPREKVQFLKAIPAQMKPETSKSKPKKGQFVIIDASEIGNHCNHGWRAVFQF